MAKQVHELEATSIKLGKELDPQGSTMGALGQMVWGDNPPFQQSVSKADAAEMLASDFSSPSGMLRLVQMYGQQQAGQIEQQLVKQGYLRAPMQGDAAPGGNFDLSQLGQTNG